MVAREGRGGGGGRGRGGGGGRGEGGRRQVADIKSNNPHLTGGESNHHLLNAISVEGGCLDVKV